MDPSVQNPTSQLDPKVNQYFVEIFGKERFDQILESLKRPSLETTLRVNTTRTTCQEVTDKLPAYFTPDEIARYHPSVDPFVSGVVTLHGAGPLHVDYAALPNAKEVLITRETGEAVLRGANVFAPGILATSPGLEKGDHVIVSVDIGTSVITRGTVLTDQISDSNKLRIGLGLSQLSRTELFRGMRGLAVKMTEPIYDDEIRGCFTRTFAQWAYQLLAGKPAIYKECSL